ncbi:MAG: hypothetical protein KBB36_01490 [Ferrovibrio sp.]|nr:hypothetical protein [Ferrovibrio sp.]
MRYREELLADVDFHRYCQEALDAHHWQALVDPEYRWGHRLAHYLLIRATKPGFVVEAGVRHGFGAAMILRVLERDAFLWRLFPGYRGEVVRGDSEQVLAQLEHKIDLFLHETTTDPGHVARQLAALQPHLTARSIIAAPWHLQTFLDYAESQGLAVITHHLTPFDHWLSGTNMMFLFRQKSAQQMLGEAA